MKRVTPILKLLCFAIFFLISCNGGGPGHYEFYRGKFPEFPVPLTNFNSEFDDYNSDTPYITDTSPLCFSSNRNSHGVSFDIINKSMKLLWDRRTGVLTISEESPSADISNALTKINTDSDELGPHLIQQKCKSGSTGRDCYIFLYSSNNEGNQNIQFVHNLDSAAYSPAQPVAFLNSPQEDAYPSVSADMNSLYFCSNRDGDFDIYSTSLLQTDLITT